MTRSPPHSTFSAINRLSTKRQATRIVRKLLSWFQSHGRDLPWRHTRDPYAIWVSEIMLQQTQVKTVLPYWESWMAALPTLEALAHASPQQIHKLWEGLGYYTRVRNMQRAAQLILEKRGGRFPENLDDLMALPGIGRYTAGALCSIAFNQPAAILDGNVIRVLCRVYGITGNPRESDTNAHLWSIAQNLVNVACSIRPRPRPRSRPRSCSNNCRARSTLHSAHCSQFNQALMELGALICTPHRPLCEQCPLTNLCFARRSDCVERLPFRAPRPPVTQLRFVAVVMKKRGRFLVRQRPAGVVNAHLWEFPNLEIEANETNAAAAARTLLPRQGELASLGTINHSITRYRISLQVFSVLLKNGKMPRSANLPGGLWLKEAELTQLPFSSAHRKIIQLLNDD